MDYSIIAERYPVPGVNVSPSISGIERDSQQWHAGKYVTLGILQRIIKYYVCSQEYFAAQLNPR